MYDDIIIQFIVIWMSLPMVSLAVWRLTYMLVSEDGPFQVFLKIRESVITPIWHGYPVVDGVKRPPDYYEPKNIVGEILSCFYCASVWVSLPVTLLLGLMIYFLVLPDVTWAFISLGFVWLGSSTGAILIEELRRKLSNE